MQGIKSMQIYWWKSMECKALLCIVIWSWNFRSEFIWVGRYEFGRANQRDGWRRAVQASLGVRRASGARPTPLVGLLDPVLGLLLGAGLSVSCEMLGERSQVRLLLVLLKDLPHTYSCTYFYSTKQRCKQARTLPVVNTGESKLLFNKYLKSLNFFYFVF